MAYKVGFIRFKNQRNEVMMQYEQQPSLFASAQRKEKYYD